MQGVREGKHMAAKKKKHSTLVWVMMGFIMLGLGGYGVTEFSSAGLSGVASVGKTRIAANDYARVLRNQLNEMRAQFGRNVTLTEAREIGLTQMAQQQLLTAATLEEEARVLGVSVGDQRVADQILSYSAFQGVSGQFDRNTYTSLLRNQDMTEADFEAQLRSDLAREILLSAVADGIEAPRPVVERETSWSLQARDVEWVALNASDLPEPVTLPDDETLIAWHEANGDKFTAPEIRHFTVAWLTPEAIQDDVQVDEQALRDIYEEHIEHYRQPARRLLSELVYPSLDAAESARQRADEGASFADLAAERGLTLDDIDIGEVTEDQLGQAGPEVFASADTGIVGPVETARGPALFSINAILDPIDVPFEEAREDLRVEAAIDQARRHIEQQAEGVIDLIAGGATLEELAEAVDMQVETLDWVAGSEADPDSVAAYPEFRELAAEAGPNDFLELHELGDGGIFALRLDSVTEPALIPFEETRAAVEKDWIAAETRRRLLALADELREAGMAEPADEVETGADATEADAETESIDAGEDKLADALSARRQLETGLLRGSYVADAPAELVTQVFSMQSPGEVEVVDAEGQVILVTLKAIHEADATSDVAEGTRNASAARLQQSLVEDVLDAYLRAAMQAHGVKIDTAAMQRAEDRAQ